MAQRERERLIGTKDTLRWCQTTLFIAFMSMQEEYCHKILDPKTWHLFFNRSFEGPFTLMHGVKALYDTKL